MLVCRLSLYHFVTLCLLLQKCSVRLKYEGRNRQPVNQSIMKELHSNITQALDCNTSFDTSSFKPLQQSIQLQKPPLRLIENGQSPPIMQVMPLMRLQMNDEQKDEADRLIRSYVAAGLELLAGLGKISRDLQGKSIVREACSTVSHMDTERASSKPAENREKEDQGSIDLQDLSIDQENFFSSEEEDNETIEKEKDSAATSKAETVKIRSRRKDAGSMRKKKAVLTEQQIDRLEIDLNNPSHDKRKLMQFYDISQSTLNRYIRRFRESQQPRKKPEENKSTKVKLVEQKVMEIYQKNPKIYQSEVAQMVSQYFGTQISASVISRCLKMVSARKSHGDQLLKQQNTNKQLTFRALYAGQFQKRSLSKLLFVDEHILKLNPESRSKISFIMSMNSNGKLINWKIKGHSLRPEQVAAFISDLGDKYKDFTIILDNARMHRQQCIKQAAQSKQLQLLYLPPFSPHLNPLESVFPAIDSILKNRLNESMQARAQLQTASKTISEVKEMSFRRQVDSARQYVDIAIRREPFPFPFVPA